MKYLDKLVGKAKWALHNAQPVADAAKSGAGDLGATLRAAKEAAIKAAPIVGKGKKPSTEVTKKPSQG